MKNAMPAGRQEKLIVIQHIILFIILSFFIFNQGGAGELRIVSTAPNITEMLFEIGAGNMLVGVSTYCNFPKEAKNKEKIGTFSKANMEKIISLKPDIVFTTGLEQGAISEQLKELGITNIVVYPKTPDELFNEIIRISEMLGVSGRGKELVDNLKKELFRIKETIPKGRKYKVLIELWDDPLIVAGKDSFVGELIKLAGAENVAFDTDRPYSKFSPELVIERNPDCIILGHSSNNGILNLLKRTGWSNITAIKTKKVYDDINPDLILRPGPRFVIGVKEICKRLYGK